MPRPRVRDRSRTSATTSRFSPAPAGLPTRVSPGRHAAPPRGVARPASGWRHAILAAAVLVLICAVARATDAGHSSPLRPDDTIHLKVINNKGLAEIDQEFVIDPSGQIDLPLLGFFKVAGKTIPEVERTLARELGEKALRGPRVSARAVQLVKSDQIHVFGGVQKPGTIRIRDRMSVLEVIRECEGLEDETMVKGAWNTFSPFDPRAYQSTYVNSRSLDYLKATIVRRQGKEIAVDLAALITKGDIAQNIDLVHNDILIVPRRIDVAPEYRDTIYVLGAVAQPARYRYRTNMSVMDAVAMAGGLTDRHHIRSATVLRPNPADQKNPQKTIRIDLRRLYFRGDVSHDVPLQPGDILCVSTREYRSVLSQLGKFVDQVLPIAGRLDQAVNYDDSIRRFNERFLK